MTVITIIRKNGRIIKYKATGHSGFDDIGYDIVCSGISSALQFALMGIQEVLNLYPKFEINPDGFMSVNLDGMDLNEKEKEVNTLLESMLIFLKAIVEEYPKNIKLVEKEEN